MSSASSAQGLHCWNKMHWKGPTFFTPSCHPNHQQIKIRHQRYVFGLPPNPVTVTRFIRIPSHLKMYIHVGIPSHLIMFHTPFIHLHPGCNSVDPWECHVFLCLNVCFRHLAHMGAILTAYAGLPYCFAKPGEMVQSWWWWWRGEWLNQHVLKNILGNLL